MQSVRQWIYILIALAMIGAAVLLIVFKKDDAEADGLTKNIISTYPEEITEVIFEAGACVVEIVEEDTIGAAVQGMNIKSSDFSCSCVDGVLKVKYTPTNSWNVDFLDYDGRDEEAKIILTLPAEKVFEKVSMEFGAAEVTAERISAKDLTIHVGAGEMQADYLYAEDSAKITVGAGALYADRVNLTDATLNCGVGELELSGEIYGNSVAECGVGEIDIALTTEEELYRGSLDCGLGEISFGRTSVEGSGKKEYGTSSAENRMDIKCGVGEVDVHFE